MKSNYHLKAFSSALTGSLFVLVATVLALVACKKDSGKIVRNLEQNAEVATRDRVSNLIDRMYAESDESGDAAITAEFQALDPEEFAIYNELKEKRDEVESTKGTNAMTSDAKATLQKYTDFRKLMYKIAAEVYGVQANKLSLEQIREVGEKAKAEVTQEVIAKGATVQANCPQYSYFAHAYLTETGGTGRYQWLPADNVPNTIPYCDSEHRFNGDFNRIKGVNYASRQAILYYNGDLARRSIYYSDGVDTGVLLGLGGASLWLGTPANFNAQMRYN